MGQALADRLFPANLLPSIERDTVRNVLASPMTGLDGPSPPGFEGVIDNLDRLLCETPGLQKLSGRFLFGVDDGRGDVAGLGPDLAAVCEAGIGFRLWVDGRPTTLTFSADEAPGLLAETAQRFLVLARASGAWRVRELSDATALAPLGPPAKTERRPPTAPPLGAVVRDGVVSGLHVLPPLGSAKARQWSVVADLASGAGGPERPIRLTPWRTVVVSGLPVSQYADAALGTLRDNGFEIADSSPWLRVSACIGRPGCASALSDVRADAHAHAMGQSAAASGEDERYPMHFSGCGRRCGRPAGPHQSVVAIGERTYKSTTEES